MRRLAISAVLALTRLDRRRRGAGRADPAGQPARALRRPAAAARPAARTRRSGERQPGRRGQHRGRHPPAAAARNHDRGQPRRRRLSPPAFPPARPRSSSRPAPKRRSGPAAPPSSAAATSPPTSTSPARPLIPARGEVLAFNSRIHGRPGMLLHLYGSSPVRAAFVLPFEISHQPHRAGTARSSRPRSPNSRPTSATSPKSG